MNLKDAKLCLSCEAIHSEKNCPACASDRAFPIARWLNRDRTSPEWIDAVIEFENEGLAALKGAGGSEK